MTQGGRRKMSKLNEILGVEDGQEFEYKSRLVGSIKCKIINGMRYTFDGYCWVGCTDEYILTEMINHPEKIKILPTKPKLTEQQITAIKGRIAEGWNWVARDSCDLWAVCFTEKPIKDDCTFYSSDEGENSLANEDIFNFVTFKNSPIYLPDLLKEVEE